MAAWRGAHLCRVHAAMVHLEVSPRREEGSTVWASLAATAEGAARALELALISLEFRARLPQRAVGGTAAQPALVQVARDVGVAQPRLHHAPRLPRMRVRRVGLHRPEEERAGALEVADLAGDDGRAKQELRRGGAAAQALFKRAERLGQQPLLQEHRAERVP